MKSGQGMRGRAIVTLMHSNERLSSLLVDCLRTQNASHSLEGSQIRLLAAFVDQPFVKVPSRNEIAQSYHHGATATEPHAC